MNTINISTSQNIDLEYDLASLGDRILGRLLDLLIIAGYVVAILLIFNFTSLSNGSMGSIVVMLFILPVVFYDLVLEMRMNGQSVGKRVMGIKVISLSGNRPSFSQYLNRWVFRIVDFTLCGGLVALILVAVNDKRQRLGDIVAGTVLVKTKSRNTLKQTFYEEVSENHVVLYPEVVNLQDRDIQLVKEVLLAVRQSGNTLLALQAQQKLEQSLHIMSKQSMPVQFLEAILMDYVYITSKA